MFNKDDSVELKVMATYGKDFKYVKDEITSPLIINLPEEIEKIDIPEDLLKLEIYEIINVGIERKSLVSRIFIGEIHTLEELKEICPNYKFSMGLDWRELSDIEGEINWITYVNEKGVYCLLAKLKSTDLIVANTEELKTLLIEYSNNFSRFKDGMSRIRNITSKK